MCAEARARRITFKKPRRCKKTRQKTIDSNMSVYEGDEPGDYECCEAVRIGQNGKEEAELTIFYTPDEG